MDKFSHHPQSKRIDSLYGGDIKSMWVANVPTSTQKEYLAEIVMRNLSAVYLKIANCYYMLSGTLSYAY